MTLYSIIPIKKLDKVKLRLSSLLNKEMRRELSLFMLRDVLKTIASTKEVDEAVVVSSDKAVLDVAEDYGFTPLDEGFQNGVNQAIEVANALCLRNGASSTLVLPADIPLIKPEDILQILGASRVEDSIVITPCIRLCGINALLRRPPDVIRTSYDNESFKTHIKYAYQENIHLSVVKLKSVMLDIDTPEDIKEFMSIRNVTETYDFISKAIPNFQ